MIEYSEHTPTSSLRPFVECIWKLKTHSQFLNPRERIIPGGRTEMMFNLSGPVHWIDSRTPASRHVCTGAYLLGPRNRHFLVEHTGAVNLVGVRFRHGGLSPFTSVPMSTLMNEVVPQAEIFGTEADVLADRLFENCDEKQQAFLIEKFLKGRVQGESGLQQSFKLISEVKKSESFLSSKTLTQKTGIHYKKLERVFAKHTGYTPKNFSRVVRFYNALKEMQKPTHTLTGIGLESGFYDQAHFIRDFKEFTGKSPTQFQTENPTIANLLLNSKHV